VEKQRVVLEWVHPGWRMQQLAASPLCPSVFPSVATAGVENAAAQSNRQSVRRQAVRQAGGRGCRTVERPLGPIRHRRLLCRFVHREVSTAVDDRVCADVRSTLLWNRRGCQVQPRSEYDCMCCCCRW
jgi:hypothetical protein